MRKPRLSLSTAYRLALASLLVTTASLVPAAPIRAQSSPVADCEALLVGYTPVLGTDRYPTPVEMPLPPVRQAWLDPDYHSCLIRVTDRQADFETPQPGMKNEYSRVQAFNADESLIMVRSIGGDWFLYDARTLTPLMQFEFGLDEPRWDATDPYRFSYSVWFDGLLQLMVAQLTPNGAAFDVNTRVAHDFTGELPSEWNATYLWRRWEGSPSFDGRYDAFMAEDPDFLTRGLVTYDRQEDRIVGLYTVPHGELNEPDSVSMSPLGDYVLAQFEPCPTDTLGTFTEPCGAMIYTRELKQGWGISRSIGHSDLALDAAGREVLVFGDADTDRILMTDLATGEATSLMDLDFSAGVYGMHFSGRASQRPGWVAISVQPEPPSLDFDNPFWMVGTVFALELVPQGRIVQLAHHHSIRGDTDADYWAEPQVTVNRDFTRLLFASDWHQYGTGEVEMYMVVLPDGWLDRLP